MAEEPTAAADHAGPVMVLHEKLARVDPHPETSHTEHGLTYVAAGSFRMLHRVPIEAGAGTVTVVPAGAPHTPLEGGRVEYWLAGFCATCLGLDESQPLMSPFRRVRAGALPVVPIPGSRRRRILRLYRDLDEESKRRGPESAELARSSLLLLLGEVGRAMPGPEASTPSGSLVGGALEFIQQHCLEPISLRDVAAAVHRTPAHVAATIKDATGYSVGQWIAAGRVAEASARLAHTDETVDEIAGRVGWKDTTHFIRQFRRAYGSTPAAWRRAHRAQHHEHGRRAP